MRIPWSVFFPRRRHCKLQHKRMAAVAASAWLLMLFFSSSWARLGFSLSTDDFNPLQEDLMTFPYMRTRLTWHHCRYCTTKGKNQISMHNFLLQIQDRLSPAKVPITLIVNWMRPRISSPKATAKITSMTSGSGDKEHISLHSNYKSSRLCLPEIAIQTSAPGKTSPCGLR